MLSVDKSSNVHMCIHELTVSKPPNCCRPETAEVSDILVSDSNVDWRPQVTNDMRPMDSVFAATSKEQDFKETKSSGTSGSCPQKENDVAVEGAADPVVSGAHNFSVDLEKSEEELDVTTSSKVHAHLGELLINQEVFGLCHPDAADVSKELLNDRCDDWGSQKVNDAQMINSSCVVINTTEASDKNAATCSLDSCFLENSGIRAESWTTDGRA
jgi:hypothetical protein